MNLHAYLLLVLFIQFRRLMPSLFANLSLSLSARKAPIGLLLIFDLLTNFVNQWMYAMMISPILDWLLTVVSQFATWHRLISKMAITIFKLTSSFRGFFNLCVMVNITSVLRFLLGGLNHRIILFL